MCPARGALTCVTTRCATVRVDSRESSIALARAMQDVRMMASVRGVGATNAGAGATRAANKIMVKRMMTCATHGVSEVRARRATRGRSSVVVRAADASSSSPSPSNFDAREALRRADEARVLASEISAIATASGTTGATRTFRAIESLGKLAMSYTVELDLNNPPSAPEVVRKTFEALGATYVKLGQFVASAPSVFPKEYVDEFQKCLDETPVTDFSIIKRTIERDLGRSIDEVFATIDPVPLASASVAQVHRATLLAGNKDVVVKVVKPDVEDALTADLSFILVVSKVLQFLNPELARTSLVDIVGDIRASMLEEVDLRKEAANIDAFTRYLEDTQLTSLAKAPYVYKQFSNKRVMVMEYLKGVPLTDLDAIRGVSDSPEETLVNALNVWFGSVLACESFHADVHAGNLLVCDDGKIGFIDFGIVGRVSGSTWGAIQTFFQSAASRDYQKMALALITMGAADDAVDVDKFARDLRKVYEAIDAIEPAITVQEDGMSSAVTVDQQEVAQLATELIRVGDENGVKFPREFGLLLKQILYFDRYVTLLAPELEVMSDDRIEFMDAVAVDVQPRRLA